MTNGLNRAAGSPTTVEINGKTYIMEPLTLRDFGTIEAEYMKQKPNPLKAVAEAKDMLPEEDYKELLAQAYKDATSANKATPDEVSGWLDTKDGVVFSCWLSLRKNHPELSLEDAEQAINHMGQQEMTRLAEQRDVASGLDELGNSTGLSTGHEKTKAQKTGTKGGRKRTRAGASKSK